MAASDGVRGGLSEWETFLQAKSHLLLRRPALLFQEAANEPDASSPARAAEVRLRAGLESRPWLRRLNKSDRRTGPVMTLPTRMDLISTVGFSHNGSTIAAGSSSSPYRLTFWDASSGRELHSVPMKGEVQNCAFAPSGDRIVVTIRERQGVWDVLYAASVFDAASGHEVAALHAEGPAWQPLSCAYAPDGTRVAIGSGTRLERLSVFEVVTGRHLAELVLGDRDMVGYVPACAFSEDGRYVAAASPECVKVWDAATFDMVFAAPGVMDESLYVPQHPRALTFTRDGSRLLAAYSDMVVRSWDTATWTEATSLKGTGSLGKAAFSSDGRLLACERDGNLVVWELKEGSEPVAIGDGAPQAFAQDGRLLSSFGKDLQVWSPSSRTDRRVGHAGGLTQCQFFSGGSFLVTASGDKTLKIWDTSSGTEIATLVGHGREVQGFEVSTDGRLLLSRGEDGVITWRLPSGRLLQKLGPWFGDTVHRGSALSPDGRRVALGCRHHRLQLVDSETGQTVLDFGGHSDDTKDPVEVCRFLAGGRRMLSVGFRGTFRLWDAESGALIASLASPSKSYLDWDATADGERFVTRWTHDTLKLWNGLTGREEAAITLPHGLKQVGFSPDSRVLATALYDHTLRLWDARTGEALASLVEDSSRGFVFSPDGRRLLTRESAGLAALTVWDVDGASVISSFGCESWCASFSPDGTIVVSSRDEWMRFWDAETGSLMACQRLSTGYPQVAWSPDGSIVAAGDSSGETHLLRIESGIRISSIPKGRHARVGGGV
jgi:WD40 repeat protein